VKFFLDNYLSPRHARALQSLVEQNHEVVHFRNKFPGNTPDEEWVKALVSESNWVMVSGDIRVTNNPAQKQAWAATGLTAFFLHPRWTNVALLDQHALLSRCWSRIAQCADKAKPGSGFLVFINRKIKQVY
jgi:hypothetical protein